ncbi:MAG: helix-turn-helix domain-containing protein [Desulfurococcales archaeon]|nr:helix-turn-helix domain-containing protein [Desulfurococcales archaeon]
MSLEPPFDKEGIYVEDRKLHVIGARYIAMVANALANETRVKILQHIASRPADLDELAKVVGQSKANISSQIRKLENVNIVRATYTPGNRGIRKLVELNVDKIIFHITTRKKKELALREGGLEQAYK